jgi:uncharacterized protein CbrC (UPF0167 family)
MTIEDPNAVPRLLEYQEVEDLINALDLIRNIEDYGWQACPEIKELAATYKRGTIGNARTQLLYKKLRNMAEIRLGML